MLRLLDALERSRVTTIGGNMAPREAESPRDAPSGQRDIRVQLGKLRKRDREQSQQVEDHGERIYRRKQQALKETCQFARDCGLDFFNPIDCTLNDLPKDLLAKLSMNDTVIKRRCDQTWIQPGKPSNRNQEQKRSGGTNESPDDIWPHRREEDISGGWRNDRPNQQPPPSYDQPPQMEDIRRDYEEAEDIVLRLRSGLAERRRQGTLPIPQNSIKRIQEGEDLKEIQAMRRLEIHLIDNTLFTIT